jgi:hypothetical protein
MQRRRGTLKAVPDRSVNDDPSQFPIRHRRKIDLDLSNQYGFNAAAERLTSR